MKKNMMKIKCKTCQKEFVTDRHDKLYCSYGCCRQYHRVKKAQELFKLNPGELELYKRIKKEEAQTNG
jgi:Zn finger protein HypA/HybF involved in hydrogenase expression